eukprot:GFUD01006007.1.p1 GENE.GFUD01006007.1~~GFUD01006007.1.p1  ORF type:complete len:198 (+),score=22.52 GFUD01006007.1:278-871(+)
MTSIRISLFCLYLLYNSTPVQPQQCGALTTRDAEGPFFVSNAELSYETARSNEIADSSEGVVLQGQVQDRNCEGIGGTTVEIWYAGGPTASYTFRPAKLWYRGKTQTNQNGFYQFLATFPGTYDGRPIPHYHYKVTTPGRNGRSLTTQVYFRDRVPRGYENYVQTRGTQFAGVRNTGTGGRLPNGGRIVTFNLKMDV